MMQNSQDFDGFLIEEVEKRPELYNGHHFKSGDERINIFEEIAIVLRNRLQVSGKNL